MNAKTGQVRLTRSSPDYARVTFDNPPLNVMGPEFVVQLERIISELGSDERVKVGCSTALSTDSF